jgi:hypothetical protein
MHVSYLSSTKTRKESVRFYAYIQWWCMSCITQVPCPYLYHKQVLVWKVAKSQQLATTFRISAHVNSTVLRMCSLKPKATQATYVWTFSLNMHWNQILLITRLSLRFGIFGYVFYFQSQQVREFVLHKEFDQTDLELHIAHPLIITSGSGLSVGPSRTFSPPNAIFHPINAQRHTHWVKLDSAFRNVYGEVKKFLFESLFWVEWRDYIWITEICVWIWSLRPENIFFYIVTFRQKLRCCMEQNAWPRILLSKVRFLLSQFAKQSEQFFYSALCGKFAG